MPKKVGQLMLNTTNKTKTKNFVHNLEKWTESYRIKLY